MRRKKKLALYKDIRKKYSKRLQSRHDELVNSIEKSKSWKLQSKTSTVKLYRMFWVPKFSCSGIYIFKAVFSFENVTTSQLYDHFYCQGGEYQGGEYIRIREPHLVQFRYVHVFDSTECITEQTCGYGFMVSNRSFVLYQTQRFRKGLITLAGESLEPSDAERVCGKAKLRGEMFFGHILRQKGSSVESTVFTYTNPGLNRILYNTGAQKSAYDTANNFIDQFDKGFDHRKRIRNTKSDAETNVVSTLKNQKNVTEVKESSDRHEEVEGEDDEDEEMMRFLEKKMKNMENRHLYQDELKKVRKKLGKKEDDDEDFSTFKVLDYEAESLGSGEFDEIVGTLSLIIQSKTMTFREENEKRRRRGRTGLRGRILINQELLAPPEEEEGIPRFLCGDQKMSDECCSIL